MSRPTSPRTGSRPPPRGRGPPPSTGHGPLRNGRSRCGRSTWPIPPAGFQQSRRPLERTPAGRPAISPASRGKGKRTGRSASGRGRSRRRGGSRPRASTSAGSRCGPCGRRGSSGERDPPIAGMRVRRGNSSTARSMSRRTATAGTGPGSRERWRGSRSPRSSPCSTASTPGKWGDASTAGFRLTAVRWGGRCRNSRPGRRSSRWVRRGCRACAWKAAWAPPTGRSLSAPRRPGCGSTERCNAPTGGQRRCR